MTENRISFLFVFYGKEVWNVFPKRKHVECNVSVPGRRFVGDSYFNLV